MATYGYSSVDRSTRHARLAGATLALAFVLVPLATGHCAPAGSITPEVIAPAAVPQLGVVWSDTTPRKPAGAFSSAPMPDADAAIPVAVGGTEAPAVQPAFYSRQKEFRGDGFGSGWTAQDVQDRSTKPAAGIALNVPLD